MESETFSQGFYRNVEDSFKCEAPTCSVEGLKVVLVVRKTLGWRVRTLDIKTAYLQRGGGRC